MYMNKCIKRINSINWDVVGSNISKSEVYFGYEFLRRLARFFKEKSIIPRKPLMTNIAKLLGDVDKEFIISDYCNKETVEFLEKNSYTREVIEY